MNASAQLLEIKSVNDGLTDVNASAVQVFISYSQQLRGALFGKADPNKEEEGALTGGARILEIFSRDFTHFEKPCNLCVEQVKTEFQNVVCGIQMPELQYFPKLREAIIRETLQLLDDKANITKEMAHILLEMEKAYINTAHEALSSASIKKLQGGAIATARAVGECGCPHG